MKYENAIKKLTKNGFTTAPHKTEKNLFISRKEGSVRRTEFRQERSGNISLIRVIYDGDTDDIHTDYCAGVWCDNLSQAIRLSA